MNGDSKADLKARQRQNYHTEFKRRSWANRPTSKVNVGSQTTGKSKGIDPSSMQRWCCTHNRSWKDPLYASTMHSLGKRGSAGK